MVRQGPHVRNVCDALGEVLMVTDVDTVIVPIPFNLSHDDLKLEPGVGRRESVMDMLAWMTTSGMNDQAVERVMRATECLFAEKAGTLAQCLETALIWECG